MDAFTDLKPSKSNKIFKYPEKSKKSLNGHKCSIPVLTRTYGDQTPKSSIINNNFYQDVENILRQIDPGFKLFVLDNSPMNQILNTLREATKVILESRPRDYSSDFSYEASNCFSCEHCGKLSEILTKCKKKISESDEKLKRKLKSFEKKKFIHLEKIKEEKKIMNNMKEKLDELSSRVCSQQETILTKQKEIMKGRLKFETTSTSVSIQKNFEGKELTVEIFPIIELESTMNFSSLIEELDLQISVYNNEMNLKEVSLNEREFEVQRREQEVKRHLNEIEMMSMSLDNSKTQLIDLKRDIFPNLEYQSELTKQILEDLVVKKQELENFVDQLESSSKSKKYQETLKSAEKIREEAELIKKEAEKKYKENCKYADYLISMQHNLDSYYEQKNKELKENGEQLAKLQQNIDYTIDLISKKEKQLKEVSETLKEKSCAKTCESDREVEVSKEAKYKILAAHVKQSSSVCPKSEDFFNFLNSL